MKNTSSYIRLATRILLCLFIILLFNINPGCKNPSEFEPEVDSLIEPPEPIELVYPPDDTGFVITNINPSIDIQFIWQAILDAEYYEFHISIDPTFNDSFTDVYTQSYNTLVITKDTTDFFWDYYWRVRASSPIWTWFTDWSEVRHFRMWYSGPPPKHKSPKKNNK